MKTIQRLVHRFPKTVIIVTLGITAFLGYHARDITINTEMKSMFPADDPTVKTFDRVSEEYGGAEYVIIMLGDENIIDPESLEHVHALTTRLDTIRGVTQVRSITNIEEIRGEGMTIEIAQFMPRLPESQQEAIRIREKLESHGRYLGTLVSEDYQYAIIMAQLGIEADQNRVVAQIQSVRESMDLPEETYITGSPVLTQEMAENMRGDITTLLPFVTLVVMLVLYMGFRSLRGVLGPLLVVFISLIWTVGFSAWLDHPLSIVSTGLPILLVSVGSAYGIHLLARYYEMMETGAGKSESIADSIRTVGLAIVMAGVTTVAGFASLGFSRLTITRDFGLFTAFGVAVALVISVTFLPALLLLLNRPSHYKSAESRRWLDTIFNTLSHLVRNYAGFVVGGVGILIILSLAVIPQIRPETNYIIFFPGDSEVRKAHSLVNEKFGGASSLEIVVDTGEENGIENPEFLRRLKTFQSAVREIHLLDHPMSVVDLLEEENKALHGNDERYNRLPEKGIAQYLLLLESDDDQILDDFIDFNHQEARVRVMCASTKSRETQQLLTRVNRLADKYFRSKGATVTITGVPVLSERLMGMILNSQVRSLVSAVAFAFIVTSLLLKSPFKGLACSIPIAVTVLVNFGIMGWTAIPLDVATSMIASIAVGIGIDYSIHFYTRYQEEKENGNPIHQSLDKAIHTVGRANYFNAFAVTGGFLVLLFSAFPPLRTFGLLSSITMIVSFLGAMVLLPSLIVFKTRYFGKKEQETTYMNGRKEL